jgi:hypothetical protein
MDVSRILCRQCTLYSSCTIDHGEIFVYHIYLQKIVALIIFKFRFVEAIKTLRHDIQARSRAHQKHHFHQSIQSHSHGPHFSVLLCFFAQLFPFQHLKLPECAWSQFNCFIEVFNSISCFLYVTAHDREWMSGNSECSVGIKMLLIKTTRVTHPKNSDFQRL